MPTIAEDHKCVYHFVFVQRADEHSPEPHDPVLVNGEVVHVARVLRYYPRDLYPRRWLMIDCLGRRFTAIAKPGLSGWNVLGWEISHPSWSWIEIEKASLRLNKKRGFILVRKYNTGGEEVLNWMAYPTKAIAEAAKVRAMAEWGNR